MARQDNGISAESLMSFSENELQNVEPNHDHGSSSVGGSPQKSSHMKKEHSSPVKSLENSKQQLNGLNLYSKNF